MDPEDPRRWQKDDYFGASLRALADLGGRRGYSLVGCTTSAVNAFFVRSDILHAQGVRGGSRGGGGAGWASCALGCPWLGGILDAVRAGRLSSWRKGVVCGVGAQNFHVGALPELPCCARCACWAVLGPQHAALRYRRWSRPHFWMCTRASTSTPQTRTRWVGD